MADLTFNTPSGQTIARELLIAYLNTGTASAPVWSPLGKRVEESSTELDWESEISRDILGATYGTLKKPKITQTFEPCDLDGADAAQLKIWNLAVKDQDAQALAAQDMLIVHFYAGESAAPFQVVFHLAQGHALIAAAFEFAEIFPEDLGGYEVGPFLRLGYRVIHDDGKPSRLLFGACGGAREGGGEEDRGEQ